MSRRTHRGKRKHGPQVVEDMSLTPVAADAGEQPLAEPASGVHVPVDIAEPTLPVPESGAEPVPESTPGSVQDSEADVEPEADTRRARHARRRRFGRSRISLTRASADEAAATAGSDDRPPRPKRFADTLAGVGRRMLTVLLIIVMLLGGTYGMVIGVNAIARWNALRIAALNAAPSTPAQDNLLIIGVSDGVAVGFTALKAERDGNRVLGIAIPDGAFMEVPGQGFERVGASYSGGPEVCKAAISNYLGVQFPTYIVIDGASYQTLLKDQNIAAVMARATSTDLSREQRASFTKYFASMKAKDVWIVPLPVKPVAVGDQRYFEPQRSEVADLLLQWWGVAPGQQKATPRVIVYNGVGTPGLAGVVAQQLIKSGFRVVDSGNADNFDHPTTLILLFHGTQADAESVRRSLGVGQVVVQSAPQDLTDMIIIVGADYRPPTADASSVPTEGVK